MPKTPERDNRSDAVAEGAEERAYLHLRGQILNGPLQPGDRLPEETIARQIGVSRTPIRGALQRLATEGFVEFRRYVGAVVRVLPAEEIDQLFQIRIVVEGLAAELAADVAPEAIIDDMQKLCDRMDAAASRDIPDLIEIARLNKSFHLHLLTASGNLPVKRVAENLGDLNIMVRSYALYSREVLDRSMSHHRELVQALRAKNPQWARSVMITHLEAARTTSRQMLGRQSPPGQKITASRRT